VKDAQPVSVGISQTGLPPKPRHVSRRVLELDPRATKPLAVIVDSFGLEVQGDLFRVSDFIDEVDRESALAIGTLEAEVVLVFGDEVQTERAIESL